MKKIKYIFVSLILLSITGCLEFPEDTFEIEGPQYGDGVTDIDGNHYPTVIIGDQEWMAEELKVTHFPNGTAIHSAQSADAWVHPNNKNGQYCISYNDFGSNDSYLYNWYAAVGPDTTLAGDSIVQGVCPDGWHLPSVEQWNTLIDTLELRAIKYGGLGYYEVNGYLMLLERSNWPYQEKNFIFGYNNFDNCTGFDLEPRSFRNENGFNISESVLFWTASTTNMVAFSSGSGPLYMIESTYEKDIKGLCIRCIKD